MYVWTSLLANRCWTLFFPFRFALLCFVLFCFFFRIFLLCCEVQRYGYLFRWSSRFLCSFMHFIFHKVLQCDIFHSLGQYNNNALRACAHRSYHHFIHYALCALWLLDYNSICRTFFRSLFLSYTEIFSNFVVAGQKCNFKMVAVAAAHKNTHNFSHSINRIIECVL